MKSTLYFLFTIISFSIFPFSAFANEVEMADQMRADGKIYVVVATIGLILAGLFMFLFWLDRRISKLEKEQTKS